MNRFIVSVLAIAFSFAINAQTKQFTDSIVVGDIAPEVISKDTLGVEHKLSDYRGHWVLLDFWASWCGDCRREIPTVKAIAAEYPELVIYGYSLDRTAEAWKNALRKYSLSWVNVSDVKGWNYSASPFGIKWIPTTFLIDPSGVVKAVALNETDLKTQVDSILKNK